MIEIYTDGSAKNNGAKNNSGGAGICVMSAGKVRLTASHQEDNVTNNQMELKGLLYALHLAQTLYGYDLCIIKCDSAYCVNIFNSWINSDKIRNQCKYPRDIPEYQCAFVKHLFLEILSDAYDNSIKYSIKAFCYLLFFDYISIL